MTILHRHIQWMAGIDARQIDRPDRNAWPNSRIHATAWASPNHQGHSRYFPDAGTVGPQFRPFLTKMHPFTNGDGAGVAYGADQLFAVFAGAGAGGFVPFYGTGRTPGDTTNPLQLDYPYPAISADQARRESWVVYRATKVPAGASAVFRFFDTFGTSTLADFPIASSSGERNLTLYLPAQTIDFDNDPNPYMEVEWTDGLPQVESVDLSLLNTCHFCPVPTTLDAAYTARVSTDTERGGIFTNRAHADRRDTRAHPTPWEPPVPSGQAAFNQAQFWLSGVLKSNSWLPAGINGQSYNLSAGVIPWPVSIPAPYPLPDPQTASVTIQGAVALTLDVLYSMVSGTSSFTVKVKADGVQIHSGSYNASSSGISITVPSLPAHGTTQVITLEVYKPGGAHWDDSANAHLTISTRRDIPYPFTIVGRDPDGTNHATRGGYLPSALSNFTNTAIARLAGGVTHASVKSSFKPGADAWYQTKNGGTALAGGSSDFGSGDVKQIDRGRTNQPYYISGAGDLSTYTPSPSAIASGGTDLTPTTGNWWAWGTVAFSGAGFWVVSILCKNAEMMKRGIVAEWSATESTVIHPDGRAIFKTLDEAAGLLQVSSLITWAGSDTTPPGSPVVFDAWVILPGATGAWAGHDGQWALWDDYQLTWIFYTPDRGSYLINGAGTDWTWFDGVEWKGKTDPVLKIGVETTGALTWGMSLRQYNRERTVSTDPKATVKWAAA